MKGFALGLVLKQRQRELGDGPLHFRRIDLYYSSAMLSPPRMKSFVLVRLNALSNISIRG